MEYWAAPSYLGGTRPNPIFARLVQTLAARGNGAPTIRIGGNSTDQTWWNPAAAPRPAGVVDRRHARVARRSSASGRRCTRTPMMLGLNLALHDRANAAAYAAGGRADAAARAPAGARDRQRARPLHPAARRSAVGNAASSRAGSRAPRGYGYADYRSELAEFRAARRGRGARRPARRRRLRDGGVGGQRGRPALRSRGPGRWASARTPTRCTPATAARTARRPLLREGAARPERARPAGGAHGAARRGRLGPRLDVPRLGDQLGQLRRRARRERRARLGAVGRRHALRPRRRRRAQRELPHVQRRALRPGRLRPAQGPLRRRRCTRSSTRCCCSTARPRTARGCCRRARTRRPPS